MLRVMDDFELRALQSKTLRHEREKWFIASKHKREEKELKQEQAEAELLDLATSIVFADPVGVEAFKVDLETYDALRIDALMENREILAQFYLQRDAMLEQAHTLEDGTRVFKSEDGIRVFDEGGEQVSQDIVQPDEIADHLPKAEAYLDILSKIEKHEAIDIKLVEYGETISDAQERLDSGEISQEEFNELRETIKSEMPIEVRRKLPDYDPSQETDLTSDFKATAIADQAAKLSPADMTIDPSAVMFLFMCQLEWRGYSL